MTVVRLKNSPAGAPYVVERMSSLDEGQAAQLASSWYASGGTLAVVVLTGDDDTKEDARYVKGYIDESRIPDDWVKAQPTRPTIPELEDRFAKLKGALEALQGPRVHPEAGLPDLGDEKPPQGSPAAPGACATCMSPKPRDGYPEDTDKSPSGRIANHCCPGCGRPMRGAKMRDVLLSYIKTV